MKRLSEFGRYVRIKRIEKSVLLYEMADALDVSPAMLSAVETGRKNLPASWRETIVTFLNLDSNEQDKLDEAIRRDREGRGRGDCSEEKKVTYYAESKAKRRGRRAA